MGSNMYLIYKYEYDGLAYQACGPLPHKYLTAEQANIKIKTLDPSFTYKVEEELSDKFYLNTHFFCLSYYNPIQDITVQTTRCKKKTDIWICNQHIDEYDTFEEAKVALKTLGINLEGLT